MSNRRGRWSTRTLSVAAAVVMLLPLLSVSLILLDQGYMRSQEQLTQVEFSVADVVAQGVANELRNQELALTSLAGNEAIRQLDTQPEEALAAINTFREARPGLNGISLLRADGTAAIQIGGIDPATLPTEFRTAADSALSGGQVAVSDLFRLAEGEVDLVSIIVPIYPTEEQAAVGIPAGALAGFLSVEELIQSFGPATGFGESELAIALVTPSNRSIVVPETTPGGAQLFTAGVFSSGLIKSALGGQRSTITYEDSANSERNAVAVPLDVRGNDWAVVVSSPSVTAFEPNRLLIERGLIGLAIAVMLSLVLAALFGEVIGRPIRALTQQTHRVARGDYREPVVVGGRGEVAALGHAIREMADQLIRQVRDTDSARAEIVRQAERLRDLLRRTVRLQEDERRRLASEIHDAVSPLITGALYQARALKLTANGNGHGGANGDHLDDRNATGLSSVEELLERAMIELHGVIFDLRPPDLDDLGVVAAIERYVTQVNRSGLPCRFDVIGQPMRLAPEARLAIYRIVQEALHNAVRHARADEALVKMEWLPEHLRVTIRDNGSGFDPDDATQRIGLGLLSMRERAAAIGATLEITSRTGSGTAVILDRPIDAFDMIDEPPPGESTPLPMEPVVVEPLPDGNGAFPVGQVAPDGEREDHPRDAPDGAGAAAPGERVTTEDGDRL